MLQAPEFAAMLFDQSVRFETAGSGCGSDKFCPNHLFWPWVCRLALMATVKGIREKRSEGVHKDSLRLFTQRNPNLSLDLSVVFRIDTSLKSTCCLPIIQLPERPRSMAANQRFWIVECRTQRADCFGVSAIAQCNRDVPEQPPPFCSPQSGLSKAFPESLIIEFHQLWERWE